MEGQRIFPLDENSRFEEGNPFAPAQPPFDYRGYQTGYGDMGSQPFI
jgi:hypothetical protein